MNRSSSRSATRLGGLVLSAALLAWPMLAAAQLHVIISGGFSGAYDQLVPEFERSTGIKVITGSGASQGTGPQTIAAQLARGVPADVVILSREGLNELIAAKRIAAGTDVDLAQAPLAVGVRTGAAKPDVGTVEAFKRAMTSAKAVAVAGSTSGIFVKETLLPRLGIAQQVNLKVAPRATGATAMVASGEADLVVMPVSEIMHSAGVDLGGTLPSEIQLIQPFAAAAVAGSKEQDGAKRLIAFLASEPAKATIRKSGMEPLGKR